MQDHVEDILKVKKKISETEEKLKKLDEPIESLKGINVTVSDFLEHKRQEAYESLEKVSEQIKSVERDLSEVDKMYRTIELLIEDFSNYDESKEIKEPAIKKVSEKEIDKRVRKKTAPKPSNYIDDKKLGKNLDMIISTIGEYVSWEDVIRYLEKLDIKISHDSLDRRFEDGNFAGIKVDHIKKYRFKRKTMVKGDFYKRISNFNIQKRFLERAEKYLPLGYAIEFDDVIKATKEYVHIMNLGDLQKAIIDYLKENEINAYQDDRGRIVC